jgi:hypothetical protein
MALAKDSEALGEREQDPPLGAEVAGIEHHRLLPRGRRIAFSTVDDYVADLGLSGAGMSVAPVRIGA